ncbi:Peroxisomal membrane protein pex16 [Irineochytrium annulatum]|nr:Peroxisomal membrane protein pex16 [Irineochytrium annulatum]
MSYTQFVRKHAAVLAGVESSLRSLTYVLPGRFKYSEIASEAVYGFVSIIAMYHDSLLNRIGASRGSEESQGLFNRYTRHLLKTMRPSSVSRFAYLLFVLQNTEVLAEMVATEFGGKSGKWRVVWAVEFGNRLSIFLSSKCRMLLHDQVEEREYDPNLIASDSDTGEDSATWRGRRMRKDLRSVKSISSPASKGIDSESVTKYLISRALLDPSASSGDLVQPSRGVRLLAELLFITLEKEEVNRRITLLAYYLLRQPFYGNYME